jgi:putative ABC transport system permease protein
VIFGLAPALRSSRTDLTEALKEGGQGSTVGFRASGMRGLLVITETALALTLLIAAALMMQSFLRLKSVDPGFDTNRVLTMELSLPHQYPQARRAEFFRRLIERGQAIPGVQSVAAAKHLPLSGDNMAYAFNVIARPFPPGQSPGAAVRTVTPDYFNVLDIPLVKGRVFNKGDATGSPTVLVINEATARRYFPNEDPIGQRVRLGLNYITGEIIGVVKDVKHIGLEAEVLKEVYFSYFQAPIWTDMTLLVRTTGDPMSLAGAFRNEIRNLDKETPVTKLRTMDAIVAGSISDPRFRSLSLGLFAALAMPLVCIGIYGVMSYVVDQHTREIGIRMALGAQTWDVLWLVVKQGMTLTLVGVAIGLAASFALTRLMKSLLFEVRPTDPLTFIVIALLLTIVALLACYLPARRATQLNPIVALRND